MTGGTLQKILDLPPGAFLRTGSGFFQRLPDGRIAFLPSIFRLPWHGKDAKIVDTKDINRLLRGETFEMVTGVGLLFVGIQYFFFDILNFYTEAISLPLALVAHVATMLFGVMAVFRLNNAPFSLLRVRAIANLPSAGNAFSYGELLAWQDRRRVWSLSLMTGNSVATLNKQTVLLYVAMFLCSGPMLIAILMVMIMSGAARSIDGNFATLFAIYCVLSVWAFIESALVLRQRMADGRRRRLARMQSAEDEIAPGRTINQ